MAKLHKLKTWPPYYQSVFSGKKTFEVRKDDRDYQVGDTLVLFEYCPVDQKFTGRKTAFTVSYKLDGGDFGIEEGYCVLGLTGQMLCDGLVEDWLSIKGTE